MKNLPVIRFLETLTEKEFKRFDQFIHSPYHNTHQNVILLFDLLKEYYPKFSEEKVRKEHVFASLFPTESYVEMRIYKLGNRLYQLLLNFLSLEEIMKDRSVWEPVLSIPALYFRNVDSFFPGLIKDADQKLKDYAYRDEAFYLYKYHFKKAQSNIVLTQDARSPQLSPQSISGELNQFILILKLRFVLALINRNYLFKAEQVDEELKEVWEMYERLSPNISEVAKIYASLLELMLEPEKEGLYQKFRELLAKQGHLLRPEAAYETYIYVSNYCSAQIKRGKKEYLQEVFELYKEMLSKDLFFLFPSVSHINFKNLNNVSIHLNQLDWIKKFLQENGKYLSERYRASVVNYCFARLYFEEKQYEKSLNKLNSVKLIDPIYRVNYDLLIIKIFYETQAFDTMVSRCDASLKYLRRDKSLSENNKNSYLNTFKFAKRLGNMSLKKKINKAWILRDFQNTALMVDRKWLMEKIMELE